MASINPLTWHVPIVDKEGRPTSEFQIKWEQLNRAARSIPSLSTPAAVSAVLDILSGASVNGSLLVRSGGDWQGLASPSDATKFLAGSNPPSWANVTDADISLSDVLTGDVSTSRHGFAPKLPNDATKYLDGTGAWSVPAGGGGGGGGNWTLLESWVQSVDGNVATVEADITDVGEVLVMFDKVSASSSGWRCAQLSNDGGTTWFHTDGDYTNMNTSGIESNENALYSHSTASTGARSGALFIHGGNITDMVVTCVSPVRTLMEYLRGARGPVNRVRAMNNNGGNITGNMTGGSVFILGR